MWASIAKIDEQVRAEGIIITPSDVQIVQSRLPGSLTEINVKLGSVVKKGDVLFRVEDKDVLANYATVRLYDTDTNQSTTCYPWVAEIQ